MIRGKTRKMEVPRVSIRILEFNESNTSMEKADFNSQGRLVNAYGFEVNAPTGHKSITLPEISEENNLLM